MINQTEDLLRDFFMHWTAQEAETVLWEMMSTAVASDELSEQQRSSATMIQRKLGVLLHNLENEVSVG